MTEQEYHHTINRLVTETFGVGRQEWRLVNHAIGFEAEWSPTQPDGQGGCGNWAVETRLAPLPFCTSRDAVALVEDQELRDTETEDRHQLRVRYGRILHRICREAGMAPGGLEMLAPAWARALALLRRKGVAVPERLED